MKKYVISSYIPGSEVNKEFLATLENYCEMNGAELLIYLTGYSIKQDASLISMDVTPFLKRSDLKINDSLLLLDLGIKPQSIDPTAGLETIANARGSLILPSTRHRFKSVPRSLKHSHSPRGIWCTGTVSVPHYKTDKSGLKANDLHKLGALVIAVENDEIFHIRQLSFSGHGLYDLGYFYDKESQTTQNPSALVLGDLHPPFTNQGVLEATCDLIKNLQPNFVVLHDVFDAASISHHVEGKSITKSKIHQKLPSLKEELELTADVLSKLYHSHSEAEYFVVRSNHDEHIDRYLEEGRFVKDYVNFDLAIELVKAKKEGLNVLEKGLDLVGTEGAFFNFLERDDTLTIAGIECSNHGDYGANGKHGSTPHHGLAFNGKVVTGHAHSSEIGVHGNYVVGTMTDLSLPYTNDSGTSGWLNSHVIIYPDGNMSHIHIIKKS